MVTANKAIMAQCGSEIWDRAIRAGINLAMEASVCGGIPIHAVLREGIFYAALAFTLSFAGYEGAVMKGAFLGVPKGELEAARAFGERIADRA